MLSFAAARDTPQRGVAFAFAQIMSFPAYQFVNLLFQNLAGDPPPDHQRCSVHQLAKAGRVVFERLIAADVKPRRDSSELFVWTPGLSSRPLMPLVSVRPDQGSEVWAFLGSGGISGQGPKRAKGCGKGKFKALRPRPPESPTWVGAQATPRAKGKDVCYNHSLDGCPNPRCKRLCVCAKCFKSGHTVKQCNRSLRRRVCCCFFLLVRCQPRVFLRLLPKILRRGVTEADVCSLVPQLKSERPVRGQGLSYALPV